MAENVRGDFCAEIARRRRRAPRAKTLNSRAWSGRGRCCRTWSGVTTTRCGNPTRRAGSGGALSPTPGRGAWTTDRSIGRGSSCDGCWASVARTRVEWRSRGFDIAFPAGEPRVLLVGFDPFRLHRELGQSNPSGVVALALHGARVAGANVRSAVLPVRFRDFDAGLVEELLGPVFAGASGPLTLAMTISMGGEHFDLERFAGRRRAPTQRDNQDVRAAAPNAPLPDQPEGPEFLEFSLPAAAMTRVRGRWRVRDNRNVETAQGGVLRAVNLAALAGATAVAGSGGAFLSNEVTYRSLLLQRRLGAAFPLGHLHTPAIVGHDGAVLAAMVAQARDILTAALTATASRQTP